MRTVVTRKVGQRAVFTKSQRATTHTENDVFCHVASLRITTVIHMANATHDLFVTVSLIVRRKLIKCSIAATNTILNVGTAVHNRQPLELTSETLKSDAR